jgi:biotin carboxyl carrier protein
MMTKLAVTIDEFTFEIELDLIRPGESNLKVDVDGEPVEVLIPDSEMSLVENARFIVDGRPYEVYLDRDLGWLRSRWGIHELEVHDLEGAARLPVKGDGRVKAPIPGQVTRVLVGVGDEVQVGQPLLILEAMKMENEIRAPRPGEIEKLNVRAGQSVALHQVLVEIV